MDSNWIDDLRIYSGKESGPLIATLATVTAGPSGPMPAARSVVIRHVSDDGRMTFTSEARSAKEKQLAVCSRVALVIWLANQRCQFRITGSARLIPADLPERLAAWKKLSNGARATFTWPSPGQERSADVEFAREVAADVPPPDSFDVWTVEPESVDTLDLRPHPHLRKRWNKSPILWTGTVINP